VTAVFGALQYHKFIRFLLRYILNFLPLRFVQIFSSSSVSYSSFLLLGAETNDDTLENRQKNTGFLNDLIYLQVKARRAYNKTFVTMALRK
jgi:hypothetical protein